MNRREFFARLNPLGPGRNPRGEALSRAEINRNELFRLAMAKGIDPATVDPDRLWELVSLKAGETRHTG